jgi:hypothetical protein
MRVVDRRPATATHERDAYTHNIYLYTYMYILYYETRVRPLLFINIIIVVMCGPDQISYLHVT